MVGSLDGCCLGRCAGRRRYCPKIWFVVARDGVDRFKHSKLHNRCVSRLSKWVLLVRDSCIYRFFLLPTGCGMAPKPVEVEQPIQFGEGYEVDLRPRRLRRGSHVLKLERIPLEILVLLVEHSDEIVTREQIVSRIWGQGVFLDTDNSIRGAIRKLRQVLKDDAETPRFIQTVTGQGIASSHRPSPTAIGISCRSSMGGCKPDGFV